MQTIIDSGDFTGPQRAVARVVIYPDAFLGIYPVENWSTDRDGKRKVQQVFSSLPFRQVEVHGKELPNVKSVKWKRSVSGDIGGCTIELWNTKPLPPGTGPDKGDSFDQLGYYTHNRGRTSYSQTHWGHDENEWRNTLMPDSMIITYQGYGEANYGLLPENDPAVVQTGVWLVDDVQFTADGLITVECRDGARLLADQISFPPVVPLPLYPVRWEHYHNVNLPNVVQNQIVNPFRPQYETSSNFVWSGHNAVHGHHGVDGFDVSDGTFWMSVGNSRPNAGYAYEWLQGRITKTAFSISTLRLHVWGGPYRVYISIRSNGVWQGSRVVPYDPNNPASGPNGADIPYVHESRIGRDEAITWAFSQLYTNVDAVRVTFTDLYNSGIGPYVYRAGVRDIQVGGGTPTLVGGGVDRRGNYGDYSDIIKVLLAWGGFYWPQNGKMYLTNTNTQTHTFATNDAFLQKGRVWGDIQNAGVAGKVELGAEIWDKKPLLDAIGYIKDILGFIFFVDEQGAAQWRSPNTFKVGNWRSDVNGQNLTRVTTYKTIKDDQAILGLRATLSSRNVRDHVFVANVNGRIGAVSAGRVPSGGFRRVAGWTDQNFLTVAECQVMADLITLRQMFTFRQNTLRIPADPGIQVDDQVEILERTTGEAYKHHVSAIDSSWELESGVWSYDLTTSWLGESPAGEWAFDTNGLAAATVTYLTALGQI